MLRQFVKYAYLSLAKRSIRKLIPQSVKYEATASGHLAELSMTPGNKGNSSPDPVHT